MFTPCNLIKGDPDFWNLITVLNHRSGTVSTRAVLAYGGAQCGCMSWEVTTDLVAVRYEADVTVLTDQHGVDYVCYNTNRGLEGYGADLIAIYNKRLEPIDQFARLAKD